MLARLCRPVKRIALGALGKFDRKITIVVKLFKKCIGKEGVQKMNQYGTQLTKSFIGDSGSWFFR